jgi:hypothetical protein
VLRTAARPNVESAQADSHESRGDPTRIRFEIYRGSATGRSDRSGTDLS